MTPEMITAIGALVAGLAGVISAVLLHQKTMALLEYRLGQVERKLDSHNGYAQKFVENSEKMADIQKDIAVIKTSLEFMKEDLKNERLDD